MSLVGLRLHLNMDAGNYVARIRLFWEHIPWIPWDNQINWTGKEIESTFVTFQDSAEGLLLFYPKRRNNSGRPVSHPSAGHAKFSFVFLEEGVRP